MGHGKPLSLHRRQAPATKESLRIFIAKLNAVTLQPVYVTYYGGSGNDVAYRMARSATGLIWIAGETTSGNLPTTPNADRQTFQGGGSDAFVTQFNASGLLGYATYLGGTSDEVAYGIAVDAQGAAYVTGFTVSGDFRLQSPWIGDRDGEDAYATKFNANGTLAYSTYLGGNRGDFAWGISVLPDFTAVVTGYTSSDDYPSNNRGRIGTHDVFVTRLSPAGNSAVFTGLFGGSGDDQAYSANLGGDGQLYITGVTTSTDFPVSSNAFQSSYSGGWDAFVMKINLSSYAVTYGSYLGGGGDDFGRTITANSSGIFSVGGNTSSSNLPRFPTNGPSLLGAVDGFIAVADSLTPNLLFSTYVGTIGSAERVVAAQADPGGRLWVGGWLDGSGFGTTPNAWLATYAGATDGFLLSYTQPIVISVSVSPATAALYGGQSRQFVATVSNASNTSVTWSVTGPGSVDGTGKYTAPPTITTFAVATVRATSVADGTKFATASVSLYPPAVVTVSPSAASLYGGQTRQFTASVANAADTSVTWSAVGGGVVNGSGLYSAPSVVSVLTTVTVRATSNADPTKSGAATVTLYPPTVVSVAPTASELLEGQTQQFTATVLSAPTTAVTWTVSGAGTISPGGLYSAPLKAPNWTTAVVTATSVSDPSKSASATVMIRNAGLYWKPIEMLLLR
jgi:hypothetical protein